ncbi:MAG: hypothetical protein PHS30_06985 [Bacteroidales bacterium]|nr:hypothetical protein [Bacteroidales bacterium]
MKWIALAFVSLFSCNVQAQNLCLHLLESSIELRADTLYFKFRIQNNGTETWALHNLHCADFGWIYLTDKRLREWRPSLLVDVMDANNVLPSKIRSRTLPFRGPGEIDSTDYSSCFDGKFCILRPNEVKEYNATLCIWPINIQKGIHKIQLRYFSNNYYKKTFRKAKKTDINLANSMMYKGILRSNIITYVVK